METVTTETYIMTSPMLYASIVNTFEVHDFFALERSQVHFFNQSVLPCFHMNGTRVNVNGSVSVSPGGHGDLFHALASSGMLTHMEQLHIEYLFTYNVDNPLPLSQILHTSGFAGTREATYASKLLTMTVTTNTLIQSCPKGWCWM